MWNVHLLKEFLAVRKQKKIRRQYLLLRTDILQKTVCLWVPLSQYGVRPFKCYFFRGTFRTFELFSALKKKKSLDQFCAI